MLDFVFEYYKSLALLPDYVLVKVLHSLCHLVLNYCNELIDLRRAKLDFVLENIFQFSEGLESELHRTTDTFASKLKVLRVRVCRIECSEYSLELLSRIVKLYPLPEFNDSDKLFLKFLYYFISIGGQLLELIDLQFPPFCLRLHNVLVVNQTKQELLKVCSLSLEFVNLHYLLFVGLWVSD